MPSMTLTCRICNKPMQQSRTSKPQGEAAHNACRTGRPSERAKHGVSGYRKGCRCDDCRKGQRDAMAEYVAKRKARDGSTPSAQYRRKARGIDPNAVVPCTICSKPLTNVRTVGAERPMHKVCRESTATWKRDGTAGPAQRRMLALLDKAARGTSGGKRVFIAGGCQWCGQHFVAAGAKWCSKRCKESARFASRTVTAFKISPKVRLAIYERDGWTCQLCLHPVDRELHYLNNWSATLDHIIPQSHQLLPDHSPKALRLAHRWCNAARGDGMNMDESELVSRAVGMLTAA